MTTLRRPGRPRKTAPAPRVQLNLRITPEARAQLEALADHWGCSLTDALERALNDTLTRERIGIGLAEVRP